MQMYQHFNTPHFSHDPHDFYSYVLLLFLKDFQFKTSPRSHIYLRRTHLYLLSLQYNSLQKLS